RRSVQALRRRCGRPGVGWTSKRRTFRNRILTQLLGRRTLVARSDSAREIGGKGPFGKPYGCERFGRRGGRLNWFGRPLLPASLSLRSPDSGRSRMEAQRRPAPRRERRGGRLPECVGFRVETSQGLLGGVEELRWHGVRACDLVVRAGKKGRRLR